MKRFKRGDKVRVIHDPEHKGTVVHQTDNRVLWNCKLCGRARDDWAEYLEKVTI